MSNSKAPTPIRTADYEAIETALLESSRGRWFLAEFVKRNRSADTRMLLEAISRLEANLMQQREGPQNSLIQQDLVEMADAISQTRREIASMHAGDDPDDSRFTSATEELDAIVEATEKATSDILEAAEDVQETAWVLRERGVDNAACDQLDSKATDIYTACSFQDLTGQRTSKVIQTLQFLEKRVTAMIEIWGLEDIEVRERVVDETPGDMRLLNGPARMGEGVEQAEVDRMMNQASESETDRDSQGTAGHETVAATAPEQPSPAPAPAESDGLAPEVTVDEFSAPEDLKIDELDVTKQQILFC